MAELVNVCCRLADSVGFPAFPGCEVTAYAELLDELPARERRLLAANLETLASDVASSIHAIESV
jgi:hypothetical protein